MIRTLTRDFASYPRTDARKAIFRWATGAVLVAGLAAPAAGNGTLWQESGTPAAPVIAEAGPFAGAWRVQVTPDRHATLAGFVAFDEAILFHAGEFSAEASAMCGFAPAVFEVDTMPTVATFAVTLTSDAHGTMHWTGRETSGGMAGTIEWARPGRPTQTYAFSGVRLST